MQPALIVSGLTVSFDGETVLNDVSFEIAPGESLSIIGPNGAGKTVLLRALLGAAPYQGTITWAKGTRVGYVPQKIDADRHLPINFKNLLAAKADVQHLEPSDVEDVIATVGLTERMLMTPVGHLSGGEFQRSLIAFALLGNPSVLILDEPTASIDITGEQQTYDLIHRLQDTHGITVIVVSHDLSFVYQYATKVLCLNTSGICFGTPSEALTPDALEKLYGPHKYFHYFQHQNAEGNAQSHAHRHGSEKDVS
jgi:zinc transport system ATP-binding protein